jgi:hypothetical protein
MRDVTQDEQCGTCLLADMTFESYTYQDFSLGILQRVADRFDKQAYGTKARVIKHIKELIEEVYEDANSMEESIQESIEKYRKRATAQGARSPQNHDPKTDETKHGAQEMDSQTEKHAEPQPPVPPTDSQMTTLQT